MNFSRKTIFVVGAALLAACGDKVTVQEYTPVAPVAKVNSVTVAPATATLSIGQSITLTAAVNADAGLATTVTWAASAANVTVTAAGVVAAVSATPGVAVCATSTVDTGKRGCASIVVSAAPTLIPASVSIQSITATGNLNTTVNPAAVAGGIDVRLNVNPGNQTVSRIVLLVGGIRQDSQMFTAAQSAALRYAADEAVAAQTTFPQVVFSVNTAAFAAATGVPRWLNGDRAISAQLFTTQGGTATAATATAQTNLTFANVDGFAITTSNTGTPGSAVDATGYRWNGGGSLTVNALPVMYSGSSIGTVFAALGANTGCLLVGNVGSATTRTGSVYVITGTLAGLQSAAGCATTNPNLIVITATNAAGDNLTLATTTSGFGNGVLGTQTGLRWDNVAPAVPAITANINGRSGGWVNDAVNFAGVTTATLVNNWVTAAVADAGFGGGVAGAGITYGARVAATHDAARTAAIISNPTTLAVSTTGVAYCAIEVAMDALGNTTGVPAAGGACGATTQSTAIGVDRAAPTAGFSTSAAAGNMAANAALGALTQSRYIATDTGLTGNSGFVGGAATTGITGTISRRTATATSTTAIVVGAGAPSNTVAQLTRVDGSGLLVADTLVFDFSGTTTDAYYTLTANFVDQAGNAAGSLTRTFLRDATAPSALAPVQSIVNPTAGGALTYNANVSDNLDLQNGFLTATFPATSFPTVLNVAGAVVANPSLATAFNLVGPVAFNTYNTSPAVTAGTLAATIPALFALQAHLTDSVTIGATAAAYPTNLNAVVNDMVAANTFTSANGTVQNPPAAPALFAIGTEYTKFLLARSGTTINVAGSATAGAVFTRTITPRVEGTTTMAAPFTAVDIYVGVNGSALPYSFVGTSSLTQQTDNGGNRTWTFSGVSYTITSGVAAGADRLVFIGLAKGAAGKWIAGQGNSLTVNP